MLLEQSYGTRFGYKGVQDRELIYLPGRGIDAVGVENGNQLSLVLGEVKVSNENASPPQVVDYSDDSLKHQHRGHLGDLDTTKTKVWDLTRRASEVETRDLLFQAALYLDEERWDSLTLIACCFMIRPQGRYKEADFGSFKRSPRDYAPATVRFLVFCTPEDIETTVQNWYSTVEQTEESGE
jgi:hypothetical protein